MSVRCPSCAGRLQPRVLECEACGVRLEGSLPSNEFATLQEQDLHFLRVFVHCEGRIGEMEAALGVSYPTVKQRMADFKQRLADTVRTHSGPSEASRILSALERGEIGYEDALRRLRGD